MSDAALRASEVRYRTLFNYAPDGIIIADPQGRYIDANSSICRMLGYARDDLVGLSAVDIVAAAELPHIAPALATIGTGGAYQREWEFRRKDDSTFCGDVMVTIMPDGNLLVMIRDLTARKQNERAVVVAEERMRFALESAGVGIWDLDSSTGVITWSAVLEDQYGLARGTFDGTFESFIEQVHPDDRAGVEAVIADAGRSGGDFVVDHRIIRPDGTVRTLTGAGRFMRDKAGRPTRAIGISQDVTDRNTLQTQFHQAQKMEAIGRLAGGVAHDFNNLLTVMLGCCEILLDDDRQTGEDRLDIVQIEKTALRAADLTRQLLALSRKQIIEPTLVNVSDILEDMRPMLARLLREDVEIVVSAAEHLALIKADRGQFEQVVLNLVVNAQDAMPDGGTLTIATHNSDTDVVIAVTDTGTGMSTEVLSRLFEPFFTTKVAGKGTGLGLATVHGILTQSGGTITVTSELGRGSRFEVHFPRAPAEAVPVTATTQPHDAGAAHDGELILVVEDADGLRDLIQRLLERLNYRVVVANGATEALRVFTDNPSIAVVLTDVVMPGLSGPALVKQLTGLRPSVKAIYMSGYTDDAIAQHGVLQPGIAFLHKPFTASALGHIVRQVLNQRDTPARVTYTVDRHDRITTLSDSWIPFAMSNDGPTLLAGVIGRLIWDFVAHDTTRHVYRELLGRVRGGRTVVFSYRCDSPTLRRFMRMTMSPGANGSVIFDSQIIRMEPRDAPALVTAAGPGAATLLLVCGWCKRFAVTDHEWVEVEVAAARLGILTEHPPLGMTHGMCPECVARVMSEGDAA